MEIFGHQTVDGVRVNVADPFFVIAPSTGVVTVNTSLEREAAIDGFYYYEIIVRASPSSPSPSSLLPSFYDATAGRSE